MKRRIWKKALAFAMSAALAVSTCVSVAAEGTAETPDTPVSDVLDSGDVIDNETQDNPIVDLSDDQSGDENNSQSNDENSADGETENQSNDTESQVNDAGDVEDNTEDILAGSAPALQRSSNKPETPSQDNPVDDTETKVNDESQVVMTNLPAPQNETAGCVCTERCADTTSNSKCPVCSTEGGQCKVMDWYYRNTNATEFTISTVEELAELAKLVNGGNTFEGKTIKLGDADIDLNGSAEKQWTPIGTESNPFKGIFDGNNRTISKLYVHSTDTEGKFFGLFGYVNSGTVKNLTLYNVHVMGNSAVAAVAGESQDGVFDHITVTGPIEISTTTDQSYLGNYHSSYIGGIVGHGSAKVSYCNVEGDGVSTSIIGGRQVGGIIGFSNQGNEVRAENCTVKNLALKGDYCIGGIMGWGLYGASLKDCVVDNIEVRLEGYTNRQAVGLLVGATAVENAGQENYNSYSNKYTNGVAINSAVYDNGVQRNLNRLDAMYSFMGADYYIDRGNNEYEFFAGTLNQATANAENGQTIGLCGNKKEAITIPEGKNLTIELNGYSLEGNVINNGTLAFQNGNVYGVLSGNSPTLSKATMEEPAALLDNKYYKTVQAAIDSAATVSENPTLYLVKDCVEDLTVPDTAKIIYITDQGHLLAGEITNNGQLSFLNCTGKQSANIINNGTLKLSQDVNSGLTITNNGTLNITGGKTYDLSKITNGKNGKVSITGGTFSTYPDWVDGSCFAKDNGNGTFTVSKMTADQAVEAGKKVATSTFSSALYYDSVESAIAEGKSVLYLIADYTESITIPAEKSLTLHANGKKISGGVINNGTVTLTKPLNLSENAQVVNDGILKITGGSPHDLSKITNGVNGKISITGGTFTTKPDDKWIADSYIANGNNDGTFAVKKMTADQAATAGNKVATATSSSAFYFDSVEKAMESGKIVTGKDDLYLIADYTEPITIPAEKSLTLHANGKTVSGGVINNGTLTLKEPLILSETAQVENNGLLNITGESIFDLNKITNGENGKISITGGIFTTEPDPKWIADFYLAESTAEGKYKVRAMSEAEAFDAGAVAKNSYGNKFYKTVQEGIQKDTLYLLDNVNENVSKTKYDIDLYCDEYSFEGTMSCPDNILYINNGKAILNSIGCRELHVGYGGKNAVVIVKNGTASDITVKENAKVTIEGGKYTGSVTVKMGGTGSLTITGGTFATDVSKYVVPGKTVYPNSDGTYTVGPETLNVKANNITIVEGETPSFTATVEGNVVNNDDISQHLNFTCDYDKNQVGTYEIAVSPKDTMPKYYKVDYQPGTLTITHGALTKVDAKDATCTEDGNIPYWECNVCHTPFIDENAKTETTLKGVTLSRLGHKLTKYERVEPTCVDPGKEQYWHCTVCNKLFADEAATKETTENALTVPPTGHKLTKYPAVAATTEKEGNLEYYVCENENDVWYWDTDGNNLIENHNAVVTAKLTSQTENVKSNVVEPAKEQTVNGQTESGAEVQLKVEIDTDTLKENTVDTVVAVDNTSDDLKEKAVNELKKAGEDISIDNVDVVLTPAVEIKNVQVNETDATITMNISLVCKAEARVNGKVVLEETTEVPNDQIKRDTVITMSVPASWNDKSVIIRHATKDRGVKFYSAVAANGTVTFTVPKEDGFSPFTLYIDDGATVTVKLGNETKTYNRTDVVNGTALPAPGKNNYAFKGWKFDGIENQHFAMTGDLFEALLANHADTTAVNAVSVFEGPLSEHPEIEEAKKNGTWGLDDNKPAATAKPSAAAVTPVRTVSIPRTSDDSNLMLWVCLMGLAVLGLCGALYLKKRNQK